MFAAAVAVLFLSPAPAAPAPLPARTAALALGHKAADLLALNAFATSEQTSALTASLAGLALGTPSARAGALARLRTDDQTASRALTQLLAGGATISLEVRTALSPLTSAQLTSIENKRTLTDLSSGLYLEALDDLAERGGSPPKTLGSRPDPQAVNTALAADLVGPTAKPVKTHRWRWLAGAGVLVGAATAGLVRRKGQRRKAGVVVPPYHAVVSKPPIALQPVLDASRRLTMLTGEGDMARAVVREALALVPGLAAGLIERRGRELVVAHESHPGVLRPEGFGQGLVVDAANAGRVVTQLVTADPSFARQPAQVLLMPLVKAGKVDAVVVVMRDPNETFTSAEREVLATYAPVAAAARESASKTQAALDASQMDPLTGAGNRRLLDGQLATVLREAAGGPTAFCMVDLDHFKSVNDTYGHPAGDALLREVCARIRATVRPTDGVYRYGGEEFCILLPETDLPAALDTAERVRAAVAATGFRIAGGMLSVTASLGVAVTHVADVPGLVGQADRALYEAKAGGRNQVRPMVAGA